MLQWNHHQQTMADIADTLRHKDLDVTLVYRDGGGEDAWFSGSRILLSASSPLLYAILKDQPLTSSTIVVTGSGGNNSANFSSIMTFVHTGEMIVSEDNIEEVIALAGQLQLNCVSYLNENHKSKQIKMKIGDQTPAYVGAAVPQYSAFPPQVRGVSGGAQEDQLVGAHADLLGGGCCDGGILGGKNDSYGGMLGMDEPPSEYLNQFSQEITPIPLQVGNEDSNIEFKKISGPLNMEVISEEKYQNLKQEICDEHLKKETVDQTESWRCDVCNKAWLYNTRDARRQAKRHMESHLIV